MKPIFPALTAFGICTKTYKFNGEIKVALHYPMVNNSLSNFIWCKQYGKPVPYGVEKSNPLNHNEISLKLEDVEDETQASIFRSKKLYIETDKIADYFNIPLLEQDVVGYAVYENEHRLGVVTTIQELQGGYQNLILLDEKEQEIMIPYVDDIVTAVHFEEKIIHVHLPEGLLDIYI